MGGLWFQLGLVGFLVLLNAAFAGSELALVSLRDGQIRALESRSRTGAVLARLVRDPNRYLATIQIGITLAGFLASASAAVTLAGPLEGRLGFLGRAAQPASIVAVTVILSYITLVAGELAPKRVAMQRAERWSLVAARPLAAMSVATRPVIWLLSHSTNLLVRLIGADPARDREEVTPQELRELVNRQRAFSAQQRRIIDGAFEIADRRLREVLRPRADVFVVAAEDRCREALPKLAASGHSRAPVGAAGSLDDLVGVVHLRDLLVEDGEATVRSVTSPAMLFPETVTALDALRDLQLRRTQLAIVIDEHGGAEGIITVEDLVEELVGEIYDETDRDVLSVRHLADGTLVVPGRFPVHDLPDLGVEAPDGSYATVAGLMLDRLQHLPERPGDAVEINGRRFEVTAVEERAITEVRISGARSHGPVSPET